MASNGTGGGLLNVAGTSTVINVTIADNDDSGIANTTGTVALSNSIVANNDTDCVGPIHTDGDPNLDSDGTCNATITANPLLGMLANNGGKTATLALLDGSPAIDAGDNAICAVEPVNNLDQRDATRPQGNGCDLGAYEAGGTPGDPGDPGDDDCAVVPNNALRNGSFEDDKEGWRFFTNGNGSFTISDEAVDCDKAASLQITEVGNNVQLYQRGIQLAEKTNYRLTFVASSASDNDLSVYVHNHVAPYANYGLSLDQVNLTTEPQMPVSQGYRHFLFLFFPAFVPFDKLLRR